MTRKQWRLGRLEHIQRRPRPRVDLYEPDRVMRHQKISAAETDEIEFGSNCSDGAEPLAAPVFDKLGSLYGTTALGGITTCHSGAGCGVLYKITN